MNNVPLYRQKDALVVPLLKGTCNPSISTAINDRISGISIKRAGLFLGAILLLCVPTQAATDSWTGATSANWSASNWTGNNPPHTADSLIFGSATGLGGTTLTDD